MSRTKVMTVDSLNGQTRDLDEDDFEVTEFDTPEDRSKTEDDEKASSPEILPSSSQVGFGGTLKVCLHASVERASGNIEGGSDKALGKPPMDWLEPLEEDDDDDDDDDDDAHMEMESLAGESERSGSVAGSERSYRRRGGRMGITGSRRRRKYMMDEGWEVWPILGAGWKRKEVFRRSGHSVGQSDTYYMSPDGERVRSRIELIRTVAGAIDLAKFDFKTGKFLDVEAPLRRPKRKRVETSLPVDNGLSESSFPDDQMDTGDRAYSPDMPHSICPSASQRLTSSHRSPFKRSATASSGMDSHLPGLHSQAPGPEGRSGSPQDADGMRSNARHAESAVLRPAFRESALQAYEEAGDTDCMQPQPRFCICKRCKQSFTGADGQMICKNCSIAEAYKDNRNISFRKWLPCGQCRACQITEDCGACASCRNGLLNPESQKPVRCRKRKCLCPIRKTKTEEFAPAAQISFEPEYEDSMSSIPQYSDSEEFSVFFNDDDDDDEDDEGGPKKRLRRSCGNCEACQCRKDCGTCDFCIDKPKFGGSNKKRQKCRLRQCQREAMLGQSEILTQGGWVAAGRPRHQHPNMRKGCKGKGRLDLDFSDSEANLDVRQRGSSDSPWMQEKDRLLNLRYNGPVNGGRAQIKENGLLSRSPTTNRLRSLEPKIWHKESGSLAGAQCASSQLGHADESLSGNESINHSAEDGMHTAEQDEEDSTPMITQIFSLADDSAVVSGVDLDHGLLQLMEALRRAVLPILWFTIMVEGPRLQLLQCSKLSTMADTVLQIDPSFSYCISVQGQPLLPTHRLFEHHPRHLTSVVQVVALLQDLEKYAICLGFVHRETALGPEPVVLERAATCEFLVPQRAERCASCMRS